MSRSPRNPFKPSSYLVLADERRQAQLLINIHLVVVVIGALVALAYPLSRPNDEVVGLGNFLVQLVGIGAAMISLRISLTSRYRMSAFILITIFCVTIIGIAFVDGTSSPLGFFYYLVIPILFSSLFFREQIVLFIIIANVVAIVLWGMVTPGIDVGILMADVGGFIGIVSIVVLFVARQRRFITQDQHAQISESEARYRKLVELSPDPIAVYDATGMLYCNRVAEDILERETVPPIVQELMRNLAVQDLRAMNSPIESRLPLRDGSEIDVEIAFTGVDYHEKPALQIMIRDITERRQMEAQRLELELERERIQLLEDFISGISHDLRTPLSIINVRVYMLSKQLNNPDMTQRLDDILDQVKQLDNLINNMLTILRLDKSPSLELSPLDLVPFLSDLRANFEPLAEAKQLDLTFNNDNKSLPIKADKDNLRRAFANLIENAIRYTPEGGTIRITADLQPEQQEIVCTVQDSGMGIVPENLPHIFTRYYRAKNAEAATKQGVGLGLAIVRKIIEMHDAKIMVQSQPDEGTTFSLRFPIQQIEPMLVK